jgi:hypothetical protein
MRVKLWIEPARPERPPLRVVSGKYGIYYTAAAEVPHQMVESLVAHVAGLIPAESRRFRPQVLKKALDASRLPDGFRMEPP